MSNSNCRLILPAYLAAALMCFYFGAIPATAIPPNPLPFEAHQPDGTPVTLRTRGTEREHWYEDSNGFSIIESGGKFVYARLDADGQLTPTDLLAGSADPRAADLVPGLKPIRNVARHNWGGPAAAPATQAAPLPAIHATTSIGHVKNLVILCMFSDHAEKPQSYTRPPDDYDKLFNGGNADIAPTGSVKDVYTENSYGKMVLESTVLAWVTLPHPEAYYCAKTSGIGTNHRESSYPYNAQGMVVDALNLADVKIDFAQFDPQNTGYIDAIDIIHSGYAAEVGPVEPGWQDNHIWSHQDRLWDEWTSKSKNSKGVPVKVQQYHTEAALWGSKGTEITRIGVIAHETGHFFGLPDLYDTTSASAGTGAWCLMGYSWGFDHTQRHPPHMSAWSKIKLGWITPTVLSQPGLYAVSQIETTPVAYKITNGFPSGEYLLIENREPFGFECDLPHGGLAIWHIDESKENNNAGGYPGQPGWPGNNQHYKIALLQASGNYGLEKKKDSIGQDTDLYYRGGVSVLNAATIPNTSTYKDGSIHLTNNAISFVSEAADVMTFEYSNSPDSAKAALMAALGDNNPDLRISAAEGLRNLDPKSKPALHTLLDAMNTSDSNGRPRAREVFARLGSNVVPDLKNELTTSQSPGRRAATADALAQVGNAGTDVGLSLAAVLKDPDPVVRLHAAYALQHVRSDAKDVVTSLSVALDEKDPEFQKAVIGALAELGNHAESAIPRLTALVSNGNLNLKLDAARALGMIGPRAITAEPALKSLFQQVQASGRTSDLLNVSFALNQVAPDDKALSEQTASESLRALEKDNTPKTRHELIEKLGSLGPKGASIVEKMTHEAKRSEEASATIIHAAISPGTVEIAKLTDALENANPSTRDDAIRSLAKVPTDKIHAIAPTLKEIHSKVEGIQRDLVAALLLKSVPGDAELKSQFRTSLDRDIAYLSTYAQRDKSEENKTSAIALIQAIGILGREAVSASPTLKMLAEQDSHGEVGQAAASAFIEVNRTN